MTGLPFVFAVWVSCYPLSFDWIKEFNRVQLSGLQQLNLLASDTSLTPYDLHTYFHENISYALDQYKQQSIRLFLQNIPALRLMTSNPV
jgi:predicted solute-binding protein